MTTNSSGQRTWQRRTTTKQLGIWLGWLIGLCIFAYCWHLISEKTIWMFVLDAPEQAADMADRMTPPKWSYIDQLWLPIWDTINIATLGTALAILIAVP
ncbi:MAG: phosphonate transport system permease protein, partial [Gammaproteobacteria bacterium]